MPIKAPGPSHSLHPHHRIRSHPRGHRRCRELDRSLSHSCHNLAGQPCSQLMGVLVTSGQLPGLISPCQLGPLLLLLLPQQKEPPPPLLLLLGKQASLPGTTLVLLMYTLQILSEHLSVSPGQDGLPPTRCKTSPVRPQVPGQGCPPADPPRSTQ